MCRKSSKDATLLYACVLEAQSAGDKRQTIIALQKVLNKYDYNAPPGVHLPALLRQVPLLAVLNSDYNANGLRCLARALTAELVKDDKLCPTTVEDLCRLFEGGELSFIHSTYLVLSVSSKLSSESISPTTVNTSPRTIYYF